MNTSILTHLAAAIIPLIIILIAYLIYRQFQVSKIRTEYWSRQGSQSLNEIGFWDLENMPEPPYIYTEKDSLFTALQTIALVQDLGLLELIDKNQTLTENK